MNKIVEHGIVRIFEKPVILNSESMNCHQYPISFNQERLILNETYLILRDKIFYSIIIILIGFALIGGCVQKEIQTEATKISTITDQILNEKLIGTVDSWNPGSVKVSPDGIRVAYMAFEGGGQLVVLDGKNEKKYENIGKNSLIFSPDSKRVAYVAQAGETFVVIDGKEEKKYDGIGGGTLNFSPNSQHVAYIAMENEILFVVKDGINEKQYSSIITIPIFSPDSSKMAYAANEGKKQFVVVNGKEEKQYDGIGTDSLVFSPDSEKLAYLAMEGNKQFIVVNGKEEKQYDGIGKGSLVFSPDSKRLAYSAIEGNMQSIIVDGMEEKKYDGVDIPVFSPYSKRVAYLAREGNEQFVVVDGKEEKQYGTIGIVKLVFSPDSKHLAYSAIEGKKLFVVKDGKKEGHYENIGVDTLVFSPDSKHLAYLVKEGTKKFLVVDEKEENKYSGIGKNTFIFSPDSGRTAYSANERGKMLVVVDGNEQMGYDNYVSPIFSPDSKHVVYAAKKINESFVVVDGKEEKRYDNILGEGKIVFDSPYNFHYIALRNGSVYLVNGTVKQETKPEKAAIQTIATITPAPVPINQNKKIISLDAGEVVLNESEIKEVMGSDWKKTSQEKSDLNNVQYLSLQFEKVGTKSSGGAIELYVFSNITEANFSYLIFLGEAERGGNAIEQYNDIGDSGKVLTNLNYGNTNAIFLKNNVLTGIITSPDVDMNSAYKLAIKQEEKIMKILKGKT